MTDRKAQLRIDGGDPIELPIYSGTIGPDVIDVGALTSKGVFTYDPGFMSTAACESQLTYIDGDKGILLHRGYSIEDLAEKSDFIETCYLLLYGELPNASQKSAFNARVLAEMPVHQDLHQLFSGFQRSMHPMAMLCSAVAALAGLYHDDLDIDEEDQRETAVIRAIAKVPTLAAMVYRHATGQPFIEPDPDLTLSENFLHMAFGNAGGKPRVNPILAKAMDRIFLLHADHEQNASTSTVRLAGSTGTNPYAALAAGVAALWGPAHGGANEAVLNMLAEIGDESRIDEFVDKAKDKNDPFRLMGFGHRVYKNFDPRAKVIFKTSNEVLEELGVNDPMLNIARRLETIAREDDYFIEKKLYPNVDFYSGIILKAVGIPVNMFTVIFATGRTPGWMTQWNEMIGQGYKIGRPRQLYTGPTARPLKK